MPSKNKHEWQETTLKKVIDRSPERQNKFTSSAGTEIDTVYTPEDEPQFDYGASLGYPGELPFT
ncbi:MAG: methylmalonyl-CoA mutase, partial [Dehalococcoidia bacterium]|nr:methylmalonyl-CoA mutase [Dehalococcoidia bacterium]